MVTMNRTWSLLPRRYSAGILSLIFAFVSLGPQNSFASRGGVEDLQNKFVVGITYKDNGLPQLCSGVAISPTIVATAAHCVTSHHGGALTEFAFTDPGVDIETSVMPNEVISIAKAEQDLAFITLKSPLRDGKYLKIADSKIVSSLREGASLTGYGYGAVFEEFTLYSKFVRKYPILWNPNASVQGSANTFEVTSTTSTACAGDSGGPITAMIDNEEVLLGVMASAAGVTSACGNQGADGKFRMKITLVSPYLSLVPAYTPNKAPTATPSPSPKPTKKRIVCIKGKVKKVVYAINPKCPKGYRVGK